MAEYLDEFKGYVIHWEDFAPSKEADVMQAHWVATRHGREPVRVTVTEFLKDHIPMINFAKLQSIRRVAFETLIEKIVRY